MNKTENSKSVRFKKWKNKKNYISNGELIVFILLLFLSGLTYGWLFWGSGIPL